MVNRFDVVAVGTQGEIEEEEDRWRRRWLEEAERSEMFEPRTVNKLVNERDEDSSVGLEEVFMLSLNRMETTRRERSSDDSSVE
ncbi:hypothetical protein F2Q70_00026342 [Brassica cretica]|uniref:Uncharacterized protein n=1 Tax=Brassica cretica TaxID=69181 RepID=A0A8S9LBJ3_BRACR|nr:hypothetical protein F2Q70_00026342 [Brassica cretica]